MGCVFEARQEHPSRSVAVKLLRPGFSAASALARFRVEPEILGRLQHPNIAQVFEAGVQDDRHGPLPFFAMELIPEARSLTEFALARRLDLADRLALFAKVCDAVHHGHQKGIVHRDLKPANILVGVDGEPKVIDFGVARATDADVMMTTQCTQTGDLVGTLRYMSPEQCDADARNIDTRSDIYSLGMVLYELLTGAAPYDLTSGTVYLAIRTIREAEPIRPSAANPALRGDLDAILLKALEKEPALRYQSAAELGEELRRVLRHEPVTARKPSMLYVAGRYARRHLWQTIGLSFALAGSIALLAMLVINGEIRADWAELQREMTEREAVQRERAVYPGLLQGAEGALRQFQSHVAARQLDRVRQADRENWEVRLLAARLALHDEEIVTAQGYSGGALAVDRVGRWITGFTGPAESFQVIDLQLRGRSISYPESTIHDYWLRAFPESIRSVTALNPTGAVAIDAAGKRMAFVTHVLGGDPSVVTLVSPVDSDPPTGRVWPVAGSVPWMAFHPSRAWLAAKISSPDHRHRTIVIWDLGSPVPPYALAEDVAPGGPPPTVLLTLDAQNLDSDRFTFSPDGAYFAAICGSVHVKVWRISTMIGGRSEVADATLDGNSFNLNAMAFSPDSAFLATAATDGEVFVWDVPRTLAVAERRADRWVSVGEGGAAKLSVPDTQVTCVAFGSDGNTLMGGCGNGAIVAWQRDVRAHRPDQRHPPNEWKKPNFIRGHPDSVMGLYPLADGRVLSAGHEGAIRTWRPFTEDIPRLRHHRTSIHSVAFSPDGSVAATGDGSYAIVLWDVALGHPIARVTPPERRSVRSLGFGSYRGQLLLCAAISSADIEHPLAALALWRVHPSAAVSLEFEFALPPSADREEGFHSLAFSRNGERIAAGDEEGRLHLFEVGSALAATKRVMVKQLHSAAVAQLAFLDDRGDWIVTAEAALHDRQTLSPHPLRLTRADLVGESFTPDDIRHESIFGLDVRFARIGGSAFADGVAELATADASGSVSMWKVEWTDGVPSLHLRGELIGHTGLVGGVAFHPTQPRLATCGDDRIVRIWDAEALVELAAFSGSQGVLNDLAIHPSGNPLLAACGGNFGDDNAVLIWDAEPTRESRRARALFTEYRERIQNAIEPIDYSPPLDLLMYEYPAQIKAVAERERWPDEIRTYALANFPVFIHNMQSFLLPAWRIARDSTREATDFERALQHAERALEMAPWNPMAHLTAGAAQFRLGDLGNALERLRRAGALVATSTMPKDREIAAVAAAYLTMAHFRCGDAAQAAAAFAECQEILRGSNDDIGEDAIDAHAEAESILRPRPP
ncbi:MAG: protein kinase [Phycisphaerae bacterium]|nr:protein kinase [Phycisphaerae bacterium]